MPVFRGPMRTLVILLLTLRVLASPLAMRPGSPQATTNYTLAPRVCTWPALRPQRSISAASLVPRPRSKGPDHDQGGDYAFGSQTLLSSVPAIFTRPIGLVSQHPRLEQCSLRLRC